jgi:predicted Fe-Mo cluster-binding NifX family protein
MKKYAISSTGKTLKSFIDLRFGKCDNIVIYDSGSGEYSIIENPYKNSDYSGVQLIKLLKKKGVSVIITGEVGPLVSNLLVKEKMQLALLYEERIKIEEVISRIGKNSHS